MDSWKKPRKINRLTHWQKTFNQMASKVRYRVEQCLSTLKNADSIFLELLTLTADSKVQGQIALKVMVFNLLKALNKTTLEY
ncbi:MAG: hypothetical protein K2W94_01535 [Alphaproteobacteria bacterium]|nr:hypothetical protein [Alphaproteobacteria bacterium]